MSNKQPSLFHNIEFPDIMRDLEEGAVLKAAFVLGLSSSFSSRCTARTQ